MYYVHDEDGNDHSTASIVEALEWLTAHDGGWLWADVSDDTESDGSVRTYDVHGYGERECTLAEARADAAGNTDVSVLVARYRTTRRLEVGQ